MQYISITNVLLPTALSLICIYNFDEWIKLHFKLFTNDIPHNIHINYNIPTNDQQYTTRFSWEDTCPNNCNVLIICDSIWYFHHNSFIIVVLTSHRGDLSHMLMRWQHQFVTCWYRQPVEGWHHRPFGLRVWRSSMSICGLPLWFADRLYGGTNKNCSMFDMFVITLLHPYLVV